MARLVTDVSKGVILLCVTALCVLGGCCLWDAIEGAVTK